MEPKFAYGNGHSSDEPRHIRDGTCEPLQPIDCSHPYALGCTPLEELDDLQDEEMLKLTGFFNT